MAEQLKLEAGALNELRTGASIVTITDRNEVGLNDELDLLDGDGRTTGLFALVVAVQPAASLTDAEGDAVVLRVYAGSDPVLTDTDFEARRHEVEAQWR